MAAIAWVLTIVCFPVAVVPAAVCIFEFTLYSQADWLPPDRLLPKAKSMAIFEIVTGVLLLNLVCLVCGIVILVHVSKLKR